MPLYLSLSLYIYIPIYMPLFSWRFEEQKNLGQDFTLSFHTTIIHIRKFSGKKIDFQV